MSRADTLSPARLAPAANAASRSARITDPFAGGPKRARILAPDPPIGNAARAVQFQTARQEESVRVFVGTSGYAYKEWKGAFYPAKLPAAEMLRFYASHLPAVEINNTFYRMPSERVLLDWAAQVPETFRFVLKASQRITHYARLKIED